MRVVAAIDQGTTSTRCILFDQKTRVVASAHKEHRQICPKPGWVEHDALEILDATEQVVAQAMDRARIEVSQVAAIGIANQRETTVVWDRHSTRPIAPAIVWQDTRTRGLCAELARHGGRDRFRDRVGLPISPYFSATKLKWLLDSQPDARERAARGDLLFGTIDSWLTWKLTGEHVTDVTNAGRTFLMNLGTMDWDDRMLQTFQIPRGMLPRIVSSSGTIGRARCWLPGVPVAGLLGDQQAALFGQRCFSPGMVKNTYGTGCFLLMNTGKEPVESTRGLVTTPAYRLEGGPTYFALEGSIAIAGAAVQWLRDALGLIRNSREVEELARSVSDNGDVYFVPAFSGLFAPHWRDDARGVVVGLTRFSHRGHIARAVLEATAYQVRDVLEAMQSDLERSIDSLYVDGGMTENDLLMQFQADILGVPVRRPRVAEATAVGAAMAAGLAVGFWSELEELSENVAVEREFSAQMQDDERGRLYGRWQQALTRSLGWVESS